MANYWGSIENSFARAINDELDKFSRLEERLAVYEDSPEHTEELLIKYIRDGIIPTEISAGIAKSNSREFFETMIEQQKSGYAIEAMITAYMRIFPRSPFTREVSSNSQNQVRKTRRLIKERVAEGKRSIIDHMFIREEIIGELCKEEPRS